MKGWGEFFSSLLGLLKLAGAYFMGRKGERDKQKEAARKDAEDARLIRERMKSESDENLDDILGGGST